MVITLTCLGVYVERMYSGVCTITGGATATAAFVGYRAWSLNHRLDSENELSYTMCHFSTNGGGEAYLVRISKRDSIAAEISIKGSSGDNSIWLAALSEDTWANSVCVDVVYDAIPVSDTASLNLTIIDLRTGVVATSLWVMMVTVEAAVNDESSGSNFISVEEAKTEASRSAQTGTVVGNFAPDGQHKHAPSI